MKKLFIFCILYFLSELAFAWDHPQTVRLGGRIIQPGLSKVQLLKKAGKPLMTEDSGIDLKTGNINEIWYYKYHKKTVMIYLSGSKIKKIEVTE